MQQKMSEIYQKLYSESVLDQNNTDYKNSDKGSLHSYIDYYEDIFSKYREKKVRILEIGVQGGISLLLWNEYFKNANEIIGVDIDMGNVQQKVLDCASDGKSKVRLIESNATKSEFLNCIDGKFDIIIDDGSHEIHDQLSSFFLLKDYLNEDGVYIIEDIASDEHRKTLQSVMGVKTEAIDLRHVKKRWDDILIVYRIVKK